MKKLNSCLDVWLSAIHQFAAMGRIGTSLEMVTLTVCADICNWNAPQQSDVTDPLLKIKKTHIHSFAFQSLTTLICAPESSTEIQPCSFFPFVLHCRIAASQSRTMCCFWNSSSWDTECIDLVERFSHKCLHVLTLNSIMLLCCWVAGSLLYSFKRLIQHSVYLLIWKWKCFSIYCAAC